MITPEHIGAEWLSRSNEERDELLHSRRQQQVLEQDGRGLPSSETEQG